MSYVHLRQPAMKKGAMNRGDEGGAERRNASGSCEQTRPSERTTFVMPPAWGENESYFVY